MAVPKKDDKNKVSDDVLKQAEAWQKTLLKQRDELQKLLKMADEYVTLLKKKIGKS